MKKMLLLGISLLNLTAYSQWQQTSFPDRSSVNSFEIAGNKLFAATDTGGVYVMSAGSWSNANNDTIYKIHSNGKTFNFSIHSVKFVSGELYAASELGVFKTNNNGANWVKSNTGIEGARVYALAFLGGNLFAGSSNLGIYVSSSNGLSWSKINSGVVDYDIRAVTAIDSNVFAGGNGGSYLSTYRNGNCILANGNNWTPNNSGMNSDKVISFAIKGKDIYSVGPWANVYKSMDHINWVEVNSASGLPNVQNPNTLISDGVNLFMGTHAGGVFISKDDGVTWKAINQGLGDMDVRSLIAVNGVLYAGTASEGIFSVSINQVTGIEEYEHFQFRVKEVRYYNLLGQSVVVPEGICIKETIYQNGDTRRLKTFINQPQ